ncbi:hypothetical protein BABINDRAFT_163881 [Babjeviella inositovora NRRL Y-12698]|uniref:SYO1-like TPR repeats domain-containing protein n=1 Tax=Babjeviella inositovora NRRL Y-12698 TaxID=984486 RepID=A0A1E3QH05_9ASCO|nr:uncharacterized protein BABINDRAFT_163881 [Babjeviella inositovora NRRL Y-12698]ODQ76976.1 hypothetical protein BABINDRAFT_163881 [Babjeviella inositovora NRRL Y-12698]
MAKLKKGKRNNKARTNPIAKTTSVKEQQKDEQTRQSKVLPLIQKLSSTSPNERAMAIQAISVLCEDERLRTLFLKERLINIILEQCLSDNNDEIIVESLGLLRNLTLEQGHEVAMHLWRSNIWVTLANGFEKAQKSFEAIHADPAAVDKSKKALLFDFADNLLALTTELANTNEELFDQIFGRIDGVLAFAVGVLNWNIAKQEVVISVKLFTTVLDFLYNFSNQSGAFIEKLIASFDFQKLMEFDQTLNLNKLSKTYIQCIKFHVFESKFEVTSEEAQQTKQRTTAEILDTVSGIVTTVDIKECQAKITKLNSKTIEDKNSKVSEQDSRELNQARTDIESIGIALELVTALLEYASLNELDVQESVTLSPEMTTVAFEKLPLLLIELLVNFPEFHNRSLMALNNLCWFGLSVSNDIPISWVGQTLQIWEFIAQNILNFAAPQEGESKLLATKLDATNVLWAISKTLPMEILATHISLDTVNLLIQQSQSILNPVGPEPLAGGQGQTINLDLDTIQLNNDLTARIVGLLASVASSIAAGDMAITATVMDYLVNLPALLPVVEAPIVVEALNGVYDVFGQDLDELDRLFVERGYLAVLAGYQTKVRDMYKQLDKRRVGELKVKAEEAYLNLGRFIDYKN